MNKAASRLWITARVNSKASRESEGTTTASPRNFNPLASRTTADFQRLASRFFKAGTQSVYTVADLERNVYDDKYHRGDRGGTLLNAQSFFPVDFEEDSQSESSGIGDGRDERKAPAWVLRCTQSRLVYFVDLLCLSSVLVTFFCSPILFMWGFDFCEVRNHWGVHFVGVYRMDVAMDVVYALYLVFILNVSFLHDADNREITNRKLILLRHLKSPTYWLWWLSVLPYFVISNSCGNNTMALLNLKVVRVLLYIYPPDSLWWLAQNDWMRVLQPLFLLLLFSHWVACLLACFGGYRQAIQTDGDEVFKTHWDGASQSSSGFDVGGHVSVYLMALVDSSFMLTGMMDNPLGDATPRARNFGSLLIVLFGGPIGCLSVAIIISTVVRQQALKNALVIRHEKKKAFIQRALETMQIPKELKRRIFSLHYYQQMSHDKEALSVLFKGDNLNPPLEAALRVYLYHDSVLNSAYFKDKDLNYILAVVKVLQDIVFLPGDFVIRKGEPGDSMCFLGRGELSVMVADPNIDPNCKSVGSAKVIKQLYKGAYFGEVAIIQAGGTRTAWVRADSYALVSELRRSDIEEIWLYFPQEREDLQNTVQTLARQDKDRWAQTALLKKHAIEIAEHQSHTFCEAEPGTSSFGISASRFGDEDFRERTDSMESTTGNRQANHVPKIVSIARKMTRGVSFAIEKTATSASRQSVVVHQSLLQAKREAAVAELAAKSAEEHYHKASKAVEENGDEPADFVARGGSHGDRTGSCVRRELVSLRCRIAELINRQAQFEQRLLTALGFDHEAGIAGGTAGFGTGVQARRFTDSPFPRDDKPHELILQRQGAVHAERSERQCGRWSGRPFPAAVGPPKTARGSLRSSRSSRTKGDSEIVLLPMTPGESAAAASPACKASSTGGRPADSTGRPRVKSRPRFEDEVVASPKGPLGTATTAATTAPAPARTSACQQDSAASSESS